MKRLRVNQISSFAEYCDYVFSDEGMEKELIHMIKRSIKPTRQIFSENRPTLNFCMKRYCLSLIKLIRVSLLRSGVQLAQAVKNPTPSPW